MNFFIISVAVLIFSLRSKNKGTHPAALSARSVSLFCDSSLDRIVIVLFYDLYSIFLLEFLLLTLFFSVKFSHFDNPEINTRLHTKTAVILIDDCGFLY